MRMPSVSTTIAAGIFLRRGKEDMVYRKIMTPSPIRSEMTWVSPSRLSRSITTSKAFSESSSEYPRTCLACPSAMMIAAADVKPETTGWERNVVRKPSLRKPITRLKFDKLLVCGAVLEMRWRNGADAVSDEERDDRDWPDSKL
eukprot:1119649-Rhodomonas_salina.1